MNYNELAKGFYQSCKDIAKDNKQNYATTYLDCQTNDENILNNINFDLLIDEVLKYVDVESCENTHEDAIEIVFKSKLTKNEKRLLKLETAKESLTQKGFKDRVKNEMDDLLKIVRPENMIDSNILKIETYKKVDEYLELSKSNVYNEYEKEILKNTAQQFMEFLLKAFLICLRA